MFDINDMAKTAFEPILFTPLQRAQTILKEIVYD